MRDSKGKFIVQFRGVRGSHPTPDFNFLEYGGNTACVEVNVNGHLIILDAGTGIIKCGNELLKDYNYSFLRRIWNDTANLFTGGSHCRGNINRGCGFADAAFAVSNC